MWETLFGDPRAHPGWPVTTGPVRVRAGMVTVRQIRRRDAADWSSLRLADRAELERWEPSGEGEWADRNSRTGWRFISSVQRRAANRDLLIPAVIEVDGCYAGQITIGGISRGSLSSAWVGYWVARPWTGGGVATAALALTVDHAFHRARLHRLDATVRPENEASRRVLARCGFREEGLLRRYLHVDGEWRDHLLVATTTEEQGTGAVSRLVSAGLAHRV